MKNKSFTLIELLVVIVIIGVLAGVIIVTTSSSVNNATLARAKAFSSNVQNSMLLNLVAQYELDNNATDSWGYHDGSATNVTYTTGYDGKTNGAGVFNGSASIRIKDDLAFNFGSQMSAFVWVKGVPQINTYVLSQYEVAANQRAWGMTVNNNKLRVIISSNGTYDSSVKDYETLSTVFDNTWHLVGFTWNRGTLKLYIDGQEVSVTKLGDFAITSLHDSTADVTMGCSLNAVPNNFFTGSIDDVRMYNTALSSSQIKQNYIAGLNSLLANGGISKEEYDQRIEFLGKN